MNKKQNKINKIYNYKLYKLPIEIIYKIIENFDNIKDLINFYNVFDKYRKYIILSIENINNYNYGVNPIKNIIEQDNFYEDINNEYIIASEEEKQNYYLYRIIKPKYKEHIIYEKIIKIILKCNECEYIFNLNNIKNIYICIYCSEYFCKNCCIDCNSCKIYDTYYKCNNHCLECANYYCLNNILNDLKDKNNKNLENIKERLLESYINNVNSEDSFIMNRHDFIDELNINDKLKNILKIYSNKLLTIK